MKDNMKNSRLVFALLALSLALPFTVATGHAQQPQQPSAKVTAKVSNRTLIGPVKAANGTSADSGWVTILCNNIKTANMKDLFITAALEVGIETETEAPPPPEAKAKAKIEVRVLRDGQEVEPGIVAYGKREQELEVSGNAVVELELETLDAASFSFVDVDVPVGVHQICVQARVRVKTAGADAEAVGAVGKGTLTVESVRLIKDEDVILD